MKTIILIYIIIAAICFIVAYYLRYKECCKLNRSSIYKKYNVKCLNILIKSVFFPITILFYIIQYCAELNSYKEDD